MERQTPFRFLSFILLMVFELSVALSVVDDNVTGVEISETSPFYSAALYSSIFHQQVLLIDGAFCGPSECFVSILASSNERSSQCHRCTCFEDCFLYHNCCPYVALTANIPYRKRETICQQPGTKPSKNGQRYSLKSTCPVGQPPDLVYKCEESTELDIDVQAPVQGFGPKAFGEFKNKYCAKCNGFDAIFYASTLIECVNSSHIFTNPTSPMETINAALITEDCTLDYEFSGTGCEVTDEEGFELIDSCNQTGLWEDYDDLVLKGCLLKSYKIPVYEKYYNIFCYMCNHNYTWGQIIFNLHFPDLDVCKDCGVEYRLQGFIDNVVPLNETSNETNVCHELDDTGICRDIVCPRQYEFKENDCNEKLITNAYGYEVCFVKESRESNPSEAALKLNEMIDEVKRRLEGMRFVIKSSEKYDLEMWNCDGKVSFRVQTLLQLASLDILYRNYFQSLLEFILRDSVFKPPEKCGQLKKSSLEENYCEVNAIPNTRRRHDLSADNAMISLASSVLYLPYSMLTVCCQTRLDRSEYDIDKFDLLTILSSQKTLQENEYVLDVNETVRVCIDDIVQPLYRSPCIERIVIQFSEADFDDKSLTTSPSYEDYYDFTIPPSAIEYEEDDLITEKDSGLALMDENTATPSTTVTNNTSNRLIVPLSSLFGAILFTLLMNLRLYN